MRAGTEDGKKENATSFDWRAIKDRLVIVGVVFALLVVVFMMLDMAVINFHCSFADFVTFECNRWGQIWDASRGIPSPDR